MKFRPGGQDCVKAAKPLDYTCLRLRHDLHACRDDGNCDADHNNRQNNGNDAHDDIEFRIKV